MGILPSPDNEAIYFGHCRPKIRDNGLGILGIQNTTTSVLEA